MSHLDEGRIQAFLDDELSGPERADAAEHLMVCSDCRAVHEELRAVKAAFSSTIPVLDARVPATKMAPRPMGRTRVPIALARAAGLILFLAAAAAAAVPGSPIREWVSQALERDVPPPPPTSVAAPVVAPAPVTTARVQGTVHGGDGQPLPFAWVTVLGDTISTWTDDGGGYQLEGRPGTRWQVRVSHPGHDPEEREVTLPESGTMALDFGLRQRPGPSPDPLGDFEPFHVAFTLPALLNTADVTRSIEQAYPVDLAEKGVGGEAVLRLWVDEDGRVARSVLAESSGIRELDRLALSVSREMRFRPARSGETAVRVIVQMPVIFAPERDDAG